jgi:choice-of-anchor B domain-containing protein
MSVRFIQTAFFLFLATFTNAQVSQNMTLVGNWNPGNFPTSGSLMYNDIWGYADCAGNEYAIMGGAAFYHFIDITNPSNPVEVTSIAGGNTTIWRDMKTYSKYAYGVCDSCNEGLSVFDLGDLPNSVTMVGQYTSSFTRAHNIYIDEDSARLYAVGTNTQGSGIIVFDLAADPANPPEIARMNLPGGYIHDMMVRGNIGYAHSGNSGMYVYDFTNLSSVITLGSLTGYTPSGYNHAGWPTENNQGYVFADETHNRDLKYCDISDLSNMSITNLFRSELLAPAVTGSVAHNPFIRDDYAIVSYYHDGLQIFDISDPANIVQTAWYDTYTNHSNYSGFSGNWGAYPFLPSGNILASDEFTGLYILNPTNITFTPIPTPPPPTVSISASGTTSFCAGNSVDLNASHSGSALQWYLDGMPISGATTNNFTATEIGDYYAQTLAGPCTTNSSSITVTIIPDPDVTLNVGPNNQICDTENLQIIAPAGEPTYNWTFNGNPLGQSGNSIFVTQAGVYQVEVSNGTCQATSIAVNLTVESTPDATMNLNGDQEICEGEVLILSVPAGANIYQWTKDGTSFGGNSNIIPVSESGDYRVIVSNGNCPNSSEVITVTTTAYPDVILNENGPIQLCNSESVILEIDTGADSYTWYKDQNIISSDNIINVFESGTYQVEASNGNCTALSQIVTVDLSADPDMTLNVPIQNTLCNGDLLELAIPAGASNYTWFFNNAAQNNSNSPNFFADNAGDYYAVADLNGCEATSEIVTITLNEYPSTVLNVPLNNERCDGEVLDIVVPAGAADYQWFFNGNALVNSSNILTATQAGNYQVIASNGNCETTSDLVNLTLNATPSVELNVPNVNQICTGDEITIAVAAGASSYNWFENGNPIATNTNTITVNSAGMYSVTAGNGTCEATSEMVEVTINTYPEITLNVPLQNNLCEGETFEMTVPSGAQTYQWFQNGNLLSQNGNSIVASESGDYQVTISNGNCESTSEMVSVQVTVFPNVDLSMPLQNTICEGETLTISVATGATNYQWFLNGNPIATTAEIIATEAGNYTVTASNGDCEMTSETLNLTINTFPDAGLDGEITNDICDDETVSISVPAGAQMYQWFQNGNLLSQNGSLIIASESGDYQVTISNGNCESTSEIVNVQVFDYPETTISVPTQNNLCEGETLTIDIPTGAQNYEWYQDGELMAADEASIIISESGNYYVVATNNDCATTSQTINVTITAIPNVDLSVGTMNQICESDELTIEVADFASGYQWYQNDELLAISGNILTVSESGEYQVIASNGNCVATSEIVTVEVVDFPNSALNVTTNNEICTGENLLLEVLGGASNYQWFLNGEITGNNEHTLTATEAGEYFVMIGSGDCSATSETVNLTVIETPDVTLNVDTENVICAEETLTMLINDGADNYTWYVNNEVLIEDINEITISQSGIYYVVASNADCVATSESINVSIMALPNTSLTVGAENKICEDEELTINAPESGGSFEWFLNDELVSTDTVFTTNQPGTYYVQIMEGNCVATSSTFNLTITPFPNPQLEDAGEQSICEGQALGMFVIPNAPIFEWYQNGTPLGNNNDDYITTEPGEYYVVAENDGCEAASESIFLSVNEFPSADVQTTATQICEGETATLSTPSEGSFQWLLNGTPISGANDASIEVTAAGTYALSVTENGCTAVSVNLQISYFVSMTPEVTFDNGILTSTPSNTYQWYFNGNLIPDATDESYTPTENGDYSVQIIDDNGCEVASAAVNVLLNAVQDVVLSNGFLLYPNPVNNALFLENQSDALLDSRLVVFNNIGVMVFERQLDFGRDITEKIAVQTWAAGVYYLKIETADGRFFVRKFVKE